jgi:hypothetical protein
VHQDFRDLAHRTRVLTQMAQDFMTVSERHSIAVSDPMSLDRKKHNTRFLIDLDKKNMNFAYGSLNVIIKICTMVV